MIEDNYGFMLFESIEKAKIDLFSYNSSAISFKERQLEIKEKVRRREFEKIIERHIRKIEACINKTVSMAGLKPVDIDIVFMTGGTSRVPCIRNLFIGKFGETKMKQIDVFTSVAYGLGASASMFFN